MKWLKLVFNFYINSSIHVALAVCCFINITQLYVGSSCSSELNLFVFFATITGYNFVKYSGLARLHHKSLTNNLKVIQVFSLLSFCLMVYFGSQIESKILKVFIPFGVLTVLYSVPVFNGLTRNLRSLPSIKIFIISVVWAGITVLIPFLYANLEIDSSFFLLFLQRLFFVIVLTLPFDIRDFTFDKKHLQTIPQLIGIERTKKLGFVLLAITLLLEFFVTPTTNFKTVFLIVFVVLLLFLQRASIKQKKYYASFWIEAIPIFWWILLIGFNKFAI